MKNMKQLILMLLPVLLLLLASRAQGTTFRLFFLGGQSNMDGYGYNKDLPDQLDKTFENVYIFHGNPVGDEQPGGGLGNWQPLQPGHGVGFSADNQENHLSDRFGPELSFAQRLQELYPGEPIALIKYSRGGSSIDSLAAGRFGSWEADYQGTTGLNQYDFFLQTVKQAMAVNDINGDNQPDSLIPTGIIWMQGESDGAFNEEVATHYYQNLKRLMDQIRAAFREDDLPVVIGKISDSWNDENDGLVWDYGNLVQYNQEKYIRNDRKAAIVRTTRNYQYSDPWHYDSAGYIDLGRKFADAVYELAQL
ncbi:MAG: sialate O-acetylesterase [Candidatus Cyclobacteriaceae bacterium M3_2C_046]